MTKPTRKEAEDAVKTLIAWSGDDPSREGLLETPRRVVDSYNEFFRGVTEEPKKILKKTFEETSGFKEMIMLKNIKFVSFCEHHMLPITGYADVAYIPDGRVVGISKIARVVDAFAKRLQIQERLTTEIAETIQSSLLPKGVAVFISANHQCMTIRGVNKESVKMDTFHFTGVFENEMSLRQQFINSIQN